MSGFRQDARWRSAHARYLAPEGSTPAERCLNAVDAINTMLAVELEYES